MSMKSQFTASCSMGKPRYSSSPLSPSMYVMPDSQAAVDMKPGSNVNMPVWPYSLRMSITSGPTVPL